MVIGDVSAARLAQWLEELERPDIVDNPLEGTRSKLVDAVPGMDNRLSQSEAVFSKLEYEFFNAWYANLDEGIPRESLERVRKRFLRDIDAIVDKPGHALDLALNQLDTASFKRCVVSFFQPDRSVEHLPDTRLAALLLLLLLILHPM